MNIYIVSESNEKRHRRSYYQQIGFAGYQGFRIKQQIVIGGNTIEIADGGLLDWTQQLLTNKKERMMTFGLGIQVLYHLTK